MATTASELRMGDMDGILRPRPQRMKEASRLGAPFQEVRANGISPTVSEPSSGRATPLPPDAPPSAKSLSSARKQVRARQKRRLFPTIEYASRVSHFDPESDHSDFSGFFVLFWIGLAIMVIATGLRNIKETGMPIRARPWQLFTIKSWQLALSDLAMVLTSALVLPLQKAFRASSGAYRWAKLGMPIHVVFQSVWFGTWINSPFMLDWTWTAQVFFTLHTIVILMKMHSYAFYNGHLGTTEKRLNSLDNPSGQSTEAAVRYPPSSPRLTGYFPEAEKSKEEKEKDAILQLREDLAMELVSPLGRVTFPQNLTAMNYVDYLFCPTLCYELEYPRNPERRYLELFWKTLAVFGCIFLLTITSEEFVVPVLDEAAFRLESAKDWADFGLIMAETISMLLFPFMVAFLLVFLVIFEYVLGAFAEITCFADRHFYSDWWNSSDWLEFSREWNVPTHNFLKRHVYSASRPFLSKGMATALTFLVSSILHEVVMGCITKKLRGYGFFAMMLQIPLVGLQRSKLMRGRKLFNVRSETSLEKKILR